MKEKKIVAIAAATAAALCLSGCSFGYDKTGVARFVAPLSYGGDSIVPAEAPSVKLGKKQENLNAAQLSDTVFTAGATYEIKENYFIHEEYYFAIPTSWKGRLVYASNELDIVGYKMRSMEFAYRAPMKDENGNVTDEDIKLMQIECVETSVLGQLDLFGQKELIGTSEDGKYSYFVTYYENLIPPEQDFTADCVNILGTMMSDRGKIVITV